MKKLMKNPHKVLPQLLAASVGSLGFFLTGVVRGWSSPGVPSLRELHNFPLEDEDYAWIAALPPLCALFGALLISVPMQVFGRRKSMIGLCVPFIFGFQLMGFTYFGKHKAMLYIGRILSALMNGAAVPVSQIYISECASPRVRGVLGSLTATSLALGIVVSYIIGAFVTWYELLWILGSFPLIMLVGMIFMPETPSWLLAHNQEEEARKSLQRLRGVRTNIEAEFKRLKDDIQKSTKSQQKIDYRDLLKGPVIKPFLISMGLMFFQQFTGINAMVFYTVSIFKSAGSTIDKNYATIIVGMVQLVITALSGTLVDKFGRRILLLGSAAVVSISLAAMGTFFYFQSKWGDETASVHLGWLPLVSLIVFFVAFSSGYANVPFIAMGELFPSRYRNLLGSVSSSFNLLSAFTVVRSFPAMQSGMTRHGTFFFFMCCTLVSMVFVYFLLPETKGKTLEEIAKLFGGSDETNETKEIPVVQISAHLKDPPSNQFGYSNAGYQRDTSSDPIDSEDEEDDGRPAAMPV